MSAQIGGVMSVRVHASEAVLPAPAAVIEKLPLMIIKYEDFIRGDDGTIQELKCALKEHGIVGIQGIPNFQKLMNDFIQANRAFSALPEAVKEQYKPNREKNEWLGYEHAMEEFTREEDGRDVTDASKHSFYALVPDDPAQNKWPREVELKEPFQAMGKLMTDMTLAIMEKAGIIKPGSDILADRHVGRLLHYSSEETGDPDWCGYHKDHGAGTGLLPSWYFEDGEEIPEPEEAGLYVRPPNETTFKKVVANKDVFLFQAAEAGQMLTNDETTATAHKVVRPVHNTRCERYTMALFIALKNELEISTTSKLRDDKRFGSGESVKYLDWHLRSIDKYTRKKKVAT